MNIEYEADGEQGRVRGRFEQQRNRARDLRRITDDAVSTASTVSISQFERSEVLRQLEVDQENTLNRQNDLPQFSPVTSDDSIDIGNEYHREPSLDSSPNRANILTNNRVEVREPYVEQIEGIPVAFPFEPYAVQKRFISSMITTMKTKKNALLESPTGTGKTLSLLCSALSFQASTDGEQKILYTTRTHQQVKNVIDELKKIRSYYPHVKFAVLGGKKHNCVHEKVTKYRNTRYFDSMCKLTVAKKKCEYYKNTLKQPQDEDTNLPKGAGASQASQRLMSQRKSVPRSKQDILKAAAERFKHLLDEVHDIEDLQVDGKMHKFCPYYTQTCLKDQANFLVAPYDYILDPLILDALDFHLEDHVVIFDEAHNVKKKAEDGFSFNIQLSDFQVMMDDLDALMHKVQKYENAKANGKKPPFVFKISVGVIKELKERILLIKSNFEQKRLYMKNKYGPQIKTFTSPNSFKGASNHRPQSNSRFANSNLFNAQNTNTSRSPQRHQNFSNVKTDNSSSSMKKANLLTYTQDTSPIKSQSSNTRFDNNEKNTRKGEPFSGKDIFDIFNLSGRRNSRFNNRENLQKYIEEIRLDTPDYDPMGIISRMGTYLDKQRGNKNTNVSDIAALGEAIKLMKQVDLAWSESLYIPCIERKIKLMLECIEKLIFLFQKDILGDGRQERKTFSYIDCFKTHLEYDLNKPEDLKISLWCFHAAPYFKMLEEKKPRSFIFASGTLTPFQFYEFEIGVKCDIKLNNDHVINPKKQLYSAVVSKTNQGTDLKFNYSTRDDPVMHRELGNSIINFISVIPNGIVVFFANYGLLYTCQKLWKEAVVGQESIYNRISAKKQVYFEPKSTTQMSGLMQKFKEDAASKKGAILFAVFRGKASEGMNFSDNMARGVFLIGIPYPPLKEPVIELKKQYLNGIVNSPDQEVKPIGGNHWYELEGIVAVNQALGRVIRHKDDYGLLLFFDTRYNGNKVTKYFPEWVLQNYHQSLDYSDIIGQAAKFMKECEKTKGFSKSEPKTLTVSSQESNAPTEHIPSPQNRVSLQPNDYNQFNLSERQASSPASKVNINMGLSVNHLTREPLNLSSVGYSSSQLKATSLPRRQQLSSTEPIKPKPLEKLQGNQPFQSIDNAKSYAKKKEDKGDAGFKAAFDGLEQMANAQYLNFMKDRGCYDEALSLVNSSSRPTKQKSKYWNDNDAWPVAIFGKNPDEEDSSYHSGCGDPDLDDSI